jgi:acetyl-CoA carboxylase carboxyltransferase component
VTNGVVDIPVEDEAEAVAVAKRYLGYFQGTLSTWDCPDQRRLRHLIPENRLRVYDVREVMATIADTGTVLELRRHYGVGLITALARIEGRTVGIIANDTRHMSGAIDSDASDKGARFLQLCETYRLPIVSLCDTPGFMVGPESEKSAAVRRVSRLFLAGANMTVPLVTIVLRKGYGLGAMAMAGGGMHEATMVVSWPSGEFGGMGLEGAVRLGYRKELEAIADPVERKKLFDQLLAKYYEDGRAYNAAGFVEIDDVIDPIETRPLIVRILSAQSRKGEGMRRYIDSW